MSCFSPTPFPTQNLLLCSFHPNAVSSLGFLRALGPDRSSLPYFLPRYYSHSPRFRICTWSSLFHSPSSSDPLAVAGTNSPVATIYFPVDGHLSCPAILFDHQCRLTSTELRSFQTGPTRKPSTGGKSASTNSETIRAQATMGSGWI